MGAVMTQAAAQAASPELLALYKEWATRWPEYLAIVDDDERDAFYRESIDKLEDAISAFEPRSLADLSVQARFVIDYSLDDPDRIALSTVSIPILHKMLVWLAATAVRS